MNQAPEAARKWRAEDIIVETDEPAVYNGADKVLHAMGLPTVNLSKDGKEAITTYPDGTVEREPLTDFRTTAEVMREANAKAERA